MIHETQFKNPPLKYRTAIMHHSWNEDYDRLMQLIREYGYSGVVTNVEFKSGFTSNNENLKGFDKILKALEQNELSYWIYDEAGYPSGFAGGLTLLKNPENEAKGLYMRKIQAFTKKDVDFIIDNESDKIVYAVKYPFIKNEPAETRIDVTRAEEVLFQARRVTCTLDAGFALYIFIVKSAFEGSHGTHNVCGYNRYINIMNKDAVSAFIEAAYEPIYKNNEDAYKNCVAVFTDEPSLSTTYFRDYERFDYALAPWEDSLFDKFEELYGYSLKNYLPYIFEGTNFEVRKIRVDYYNLVGSMICNAFTKQLSEWCGKHGAAFSGHYLAEESIVSQVGSYGNFVSALRGAAKPGMDILECTPEIYRPNAAKYINMINRKNNVNGFMVELCPFFQIELFNLAPYDNMLGTINLLFLGGVRHCNTYYLPYIKDNGKVYISGCLDKEQANSFNEYVGRLGLMLENTHSCTDTFIYYPIEDVQAKFEPENSAINGSKYQMNKSDISIDKIAKVIHAKGFQYEIVDSEDILSLCNMGQPMLAGNVVKTLIIPNMDYINDEVAKSLQKLKNKNITIVFEGSLPKHGITSKDIAAYLTGFRATTTEGILDLLAKQSSRLNVSSKNNTDFYLGKYIKEGNTFYMLVNGINECTEFKIYNTPDSALEIYDIGSGTVYSTQDFTLTINGYRAVFFRTI